MKCGVVDVGSNTIQLAIYEYEGSKFKALLNQWETVGLSSYVSQGVLSPDGMDAACGTLARFRSLLDSLGIGSMRVFATASLRNIANSPAALAAILDRTGLTVDLLSGEEEARFSFRGALAGGAPASGLLCDVGGGSAELVAYRDGQMTSAVSLPVGVVALFTQFSQGLFPTYAEQEVMGNHVAKLLDGQPLSPAQNLLGVGGTARAVVGLCNRMGGAPPQRVAVSVREVNSLYSALAQGGKAALQLILKVAPDRIHTVLPGLIILTKILSRCSAETFTMSPTGVREGYLLERIMGQAPDIE